MARTPGIYVPLDANYLRDPAVRRAGPDAELLYIRSLAHSKSADTDGLILTCDLPVIAIGLKTVQKRVDALLREGLWTEDPEGWLIRSWSRWNMTRDERVNDKAKRRIGAMMTNHGKGAHNDRIDPECPRCSETLERALERAHLRTQEKGTQREGRGKGTQREGNPEGSAAFQDFSSSSHPGNATLARLGIPDGIGGGWDA